MITWTGWGSRQGKPSRDVTRRAHRYRARRRIPAGPRLCALCGSKRFLVVDHKDNDETNDDPGNLRWLCKSCNTRLGIAAAKAGLGKRTNRINPGAETLAQYVSAAVYHQRGAHDAGGFVIHQTPKERRRRFAKEIWRRRRRSGR
jgi:5-methylcytosine-specific restriction endonuclease McrA